MQVKRRPNAGQTQTKCRPNAYQMQAKRVPNPGQTHTKCRPNAYQMQVKRRPNAGQIETKCRSICSAPGPDHLGAVFQRVHPISATPFPRMRTASAMDELPGVHL